MTPPSRPKIRLATRADLPDLLSMMRAFSRDDLVPWRRERVLPGLARLLREPRLGRVLVGETSEDGTLSGYAVGTFGYDLEFGGTDAFLTEIYVRPRHRRTGEGRRLLEAITETMRRGGAAAFHLAVRADNQVARRLYATAGFAPIERLVLSKRLRAPRKSRPRARR